MAFDLMSMFRGLPAQSQAPTNQPTPGNIPDSATQQLTSLQNPTTAPNGAIPPNTNISDITPASPLDQFKDLWQTPTNIKTVEPLFNIDQARLDAAAKSQNFTKTITEAQLVAIGKGGPDAMKAFAEALNTVGQDIYARSAVATTKLIENALGKNNTTLEAKFPEMIRSHQLTDQLRTENPALNHPAAQPLISAMESQLLVKFPNASTAELRSMAGDYILALTQSLSPTKPTVSSTTGGDTDWSTYLQ